MPRLKLLKPMIAKLTPFFLFTLSCSLSVVPPFPTPYSPLPAAAQTVDDRKAEADRLFQQGLDQYLRGAMEQAIEPWERALSLYEQTQNYQGQTLALFGIGVAYKNLGETVKGGHYIQMASLRQIAVRQQDETLAAIGFILAYLSLDWKDEAIAKEYNRLLVARNHHEQQQEIEVLTRLGAIHAAREEYAKAVEYYQQSLAVARQIKNSQIEKTALMGLGKVYFLLGEHARVVEYRQQSLATARELQNRLEEMTALTGLARAYTSLGEHARAIEYYQQSLIIAKEVNHAEGKQIALVGLAYISAAQGKPLEAVEFYRQGSTVNIPTKRVTAIFNSPTVLEIIGQVSSIVFNLQTGSSSENSLLLQREVPLITGISSAADNSKVIELYQQSLAIARKVQDRQGETVALIGLANVYAATGEYAKAIEYHQQSLAIARSLLDRQGERAALIGLSNTYFALGDYAKAREYYQKSLTLDREPGQQLVVQDDQSRRGNQATSAKLTNTYYALGEYAKAIEYYQKSLDINQEIQNRQGEQLALIALGSAYYAIGENAKAIEYYHKGLDVAQAIKDVQGERTALSGLILTRLSLGEYAQVIALYQQSLAIAKKTSDRKGEQTDLTGLGKAYFSEGDYTNAIKSYQQGLAISQETKDRQAEQQALLNLGRSLAFLGKQMEAIQNYQRSLKIAQDTKDERTQQTALVGLGRAYASDSQYDKALEYYQRSLEITRKNKDRQAEGVALSELGNVFYQIGNLAEAEKTLLASLQIQESLRARLGDVEKVSIFETQRNAYTSLQQVLIAQNKSNAALEIAERGRTRTFVELLARRLSLTPISSINVLPPSLEEIKQIAKAQNATLVEYSIIYEQFKAQDSLLLRESDLYIWVIKPTGEISFRKVDLKPLWQQHNISLADLVVTNQEFIGVRARDRGIAVVDTTKPATQKLYQLQELYKLLITPIADLLPTQPDDHVIFIPQDALFLVPFPALQDTKGEYLIKKHTILTAPSIQVLEKTHSLRTSLSSASLNTTQGRDALILGNPTMPKVVLRPGEPAEQLPILAGAEKEAKAIAPLLNTQPILGAQGTKAAIVQKMSQAAIIHLATHGLLDNVRGLGSAIALAPSGNDDGWLTAEEILDMKLQANLVVLSACNTAEGRITGDGVIGLSRALIAAGVPSVVVSLWSVPDAPTAALMQTFYQNLQKNPDKAQALRQAMLTTMKTHPQPRDWAAFTLIGEAE